MSKKQQTLFQSWTSKQPEGNKPSKTTSNAAVDEVTLLDSDEDEALCQAFEESLRNYYENEKPQEQQRNALYPPAERPSTSSYFPEPPAVEPSFVDTIPGFDNNSGNTWVYPTNKPVRKYQRDIVETCIFHNTLVTLPTGLGTILLYSSLLFSKASLLIILFFTFR